MSLQNYANSLFYSVQFSFHQEHVSIETLESDDPTPAWFLNWWKIYGLSQWVIKPGHLHLLDIPGFSNRYAPYTIMQDLVRDLKNISDEDFMLSTRRCGHVRWFITNKYAARFVQLQDSQYDDFHSQVDTETNPFGPIEYLVPPDNADEDGWEAEHEVIIQYFTTHLIERFGFGQHYSYPQARHYVMI